MDKHFIRCFAKYTSATGNGAKVIIKTNINTQIINDDGYIKLKIDSEIGKREIITVLFFLLSFLRLGTLLI